MNIWYLWCCQSLHFAYAPFWVFREGKDNIYGLSLLVVLSSPPAVIKNTNFKSTVLSYMYQIYKGHLKHIISIRF